MQIIYLKCADHSGMCILRSIKSEKREVVDDLNDFLLTVNSYW